MSSDAQFGISRILRPFTDFETDYQGQPVATTPIMFTEGGVALDPQAGETGYASNLIKGLSVAYGQRVGIWFPLVAGVAGGVLPFSSYPYIYRLIWRQRNVFDFRQARIPYHFPQQVDGVPDGVNPRVVIPACVETITYSESPEPSDGPATSNLRSDQDRIVAASLSRPLVPGGGLGIAQQGVFDPAINPTTAGMPLFAFYDTNAKGDELLIACTRGAEPYPTGGSGGTQTNWDFAGADLNFSRMFGDGFGQAYPAIGIYINVGMAP